MADPPGAVLCDLDGTLVDSTPMWRQVYLEVAEAHDLTLPDGWWELVAGRDLAGSIAALAGDRTPPGRIATLADELTDRAVHLAAQGPSLVSLRPGAAALLRLLADREVPHTIVTTTPRALLDALATRLGLPGGGVAGDEVARPKPAPDPYLQAAALLGVRPADCVVVEDSPTGVAAAEAAGMRVLAVPHTVAVPTAPTRRVVDSLVGIGPADLAGLPLPRA